MKSEMKEVSLRETNKCRGDRSHAVDLESPVDNHESPVDNHESPVDILESLVAGREDASLQGQLVATGEPLKFASIRKGVA